jgi:Condensation domain/TubC N-terminal docking domain
MKSELNHEGASPDPLRSRDLRELTSAEFLALLDRNNIRLQARDENLVVNAPAGVLDDQLRAECKRRKADLLILLGTAKEVSSKPPLLSVKRGGRIPMTPSQQGIWLIDHFNPGNAAYNIPEAFLFNFSLNLELLQKSIDLLIARHEILRTGFHEEDGELYQAIAAEAHIEAGCTDLRSLSEAEAASRCRSLIREHAQTPFDLRFPPLVRFHFFRVTAQRDVLLVNIHHIIADLQALFILREELMVCYQAFSAKTAPDLPDLPLQFADYAFSADQQLRDGTMESQVQYWREKLAGLPPFLELPLNGTYPEKRSFRGAKVALVVPSAVRRALNRIGRECGATPFMTFLAGFAVLIARFSGQHDFCIGSPVTQRSGIETQRMIGLFMNMVAFRVQIAEQHSFRSIVRQVRATTLEAYEHRDVPFQTLVRALRFNRRSPRSPIFQVMFGFEPARVADPAFWQFDSDPGTARYDLSLLLSESADGKAYGYLEYRIDIFQEDEVAALTRQFLDLLQEVAETPDRPVVSRPLG